MTTPFDVSCVCEHPNVEDRAGSGRTTRYRNLKNLPIPDDLLLPTCTVCGEWFLSRSSAAAIDREMILIYHDALWKLAQSTLDCLHGWGVKDRDLEPLLGLPPRYLAKVYSGDYHATSELIACLGFIAHDPKRIQELQEIFG